MGTNIWNGIKNISEIFWGNGESAGYIVPFLLSIILLFLWLKNKEAKDMLGRYSILMLLLIYNPIFFILSALWLSGSTITWKAYVAAGSLNYLRVFYALPVTFLIAFVFVEAADRLKKKWKKAVLITSCVVIFLLTSKNVYCNGNYAKADNWHKVPEDTVAVCEIMRRNIEPDEEIKVLVTNDLIIYIRQYAAEVTMPYGRASMTEERAVAFSEGTITKEEWDKWMEDMNCNFIVCNWHSDLLDLLQDSGYAIVGETAGHVVLKAQKE